MANSNARFHTKCIVCDSTKLQDLKDFEKVGLCKCGNCGMVFMKEIPTLEQINDHYKNYSYDREVFVSPVTIQRYNEILDSFEKYRVNNLLLDVGCGAGLFLKVAKERGWNVFGTEYSEKAVEVCQDKGITMKKGALNAKDFDGLQFDVVTSFEVIEHINNPVEEMTQITELMRPGGLFYCTTPNFNGLPRYYLKADYSIIEFPEHLSYYTPKTLKFLCKKMGLSPLDVTATGISFSRLSKDLNKDKAEVKSEPIVGAASKDEQVRQAMESNPLLKVVKSIANTLFIMTGTGVALKGYFIKPK